MFRKVFALTAVGLALAGCAVGPNYHRPAAMTAAAEAPAAFKEADGWTQAEPSDAVSRQDWWKVFNDPVLDDLEAQVSVSNQNLAQSEAAYRQAKAVLDQQRAALFPTISLTGTAARSQSPSGFTGAQGALSSGAKPISTFATGVGLTWDVDLWGRIRRQIEAAHANAQASAGDLANATLAAQALLAADYFQLRQADEAGRLIEQTVKGYADSLRIAQARFKSGVGAESDELSAQVQLKSAQAQAEDLVRTRAQFEHAIAVLVGKAPADLSIAPGAWNSAVPAAPVSLPATLLQRRPDIAAAERRMKAANAEIGVNVAGYFPDVTVSGQYGFTSVVLDQLLNARNNSWSIGGNAAEALFNAGATSAKVRQARAGYDAAVAGYRQTVLTAFQEVEDNIAALRVLAAEYELDQAASQEADRAEQLTTKQYQAGQVDFTAVVVAQKIALDARRTALAASGNRLVAVVDLVKAMGGGWSQTHLAQK
ncbi:MAG: efflux transporter outer membrane subunit [Caulobacteraceae bacterium]